MAPTTRSHGRPLLKSLNLNSTPVNNKTNKCGSKTTTMTSPQPSSTKKEKKTVNIIIPDDDKISSDNTNTVAVISDDDKVQVNTNHDDCVDAAADEVMIETTVEDAVAPIAIEVQVLQEQRRLRKWQHADFNVLEKLGQGFSATVFKAIHIITGDVYALKQIDYRYSINKGYVKRELEIHTDLSLSSSSSSTAETNGIVQLYGHYYYTPPENNNGQTNDIDNDEPMFLYLVLQYCPSTLLQIVQKEGALSESRISRYINEIVHALTYLQQVGNIIHRDIKLANILVTANDTIQLADFGIATRSCSNKPRKTTEIGTAGYMAPEIEDGLSCYTSKVDLWSLGVLIHALVTGNLPCEGNDDDDDSSSGFGFMCGAPDIDLEIPDSVSNEITSLLEGLLEEDPNRRLSLDQIRNHCFLVR
jgi:serine/threonine protein kinase